MCSNDNIMDKFEIERSRIKVKVTVAISNEILSSLSHLFYKLVFILLHTNM